MNAENITRFRQAVETVEYARNHGGGSVTLAQVDELTEAANLADRELHQAERTIKKLTDWLTSAVDPSAEPADGTLLMMCSPDGSDSEMVVIRDDTAARESGYGERRWFEVRPDGDDGPDTWDMTASAVDWAATVWVRLVPAIADRRDVS